MQKKGMKNLWIRNEDWQKLSMRKIKTGKATIAEVVTDVLTENENRGETT